MLRSMLSPSRSFHRVPMLYGVCHLRMIGERHLGEGELPALGLLRQMSAKRAFCWKGLPFSVPLRFTHPPK
jgi:hypothetical protein